MRKETEDSLEEIGFLLGRLAFLLVVDATLAGTLFLITSYLIGFSIPYLKIYGIILAVHFGVNFIKNIFLKK